MTDSLVGLVSGFQVNSFCFFLVVKLGLLLVEAGKNSCHDDDDDNDNFYVIR